MFDKSIGYWAKKGLQGEPAVRDTACSEVIPIGAS